MFRVKDIAIRGPLTTIFLDSIVDVSKEKLGLKYNADYTIKDIKCGFQDLKTMVGDTSGFDFEMRVSEDPSNPFPGFLADGRSEETCAIHDELIKKITDGVFNTYGMDVGIYFNRWGSGSIIIGGSVILVQGELTADLKSSIVDVIKEETTKYFNSPCVTLKEIHTNTVDESKLKLSLLVCTANENVVKQIQHIQPSLSDLFLENVNMRINGRLFIQLIK